MAMRSFVREECRSSRCERICCVVTVVGLMWGILRSRSRGMVFGLSSCHLLVAFRRVSESVRGCAKMDHRCRRRACIRAICFAILLTVEEAKGLRWKCTQKPYISSACLRASSWACSSRSVGFVGRLGWRSARS
eukprot:2297600-Rhodomonas_salina.2